MRIALYQPDIPQNAGTLIRTGACLGLAVDIIGPAGFDVSDRALARAGLDYAEKAAVRWHESFAAFEQWRILEPKARAEAEACLKRLVEAGLSENAMDIASRALSGPA